MLMLALPMRKYKKMYTVVTIISTKCPLSKIYLNRRKGKLNSSYGMSDKTITIMWLWELRNRIWKKTF